MAATYKDSPSAGAVNGSNKEFTYDFPVLQTEDIKVALNGVTQATTKYTALLSPAKITFNNTSVDSSVQETDGSPKAGVNVRVYRETTVGKNTGDEDPKIVFAAGSSIRAGDLNANTEQALFSIHEIQEQPIQTEQLADGAVKSAKIEDGTIVNADVNASAAIAGTKISPDFGSQNIATTGTVNSVTTTELSILDGATVSTAELNILDGVTSTAAELNLLDGVTATTAEINHVDGVTSNIQTQLDAKQTSDGDLTTLAGMQSGTASILASGTTLTSTLAELNLLDGKSIVTAVSGSSTDVQLPTAKAVNDQIVNLLNDTGGFKPIDNEVSFPTTNPDPDDGAGTIVSIADAGGLKVADGSGSGDYAGTAGNSIGATTTAGVAVTITGIDTTLRGTTIAAGKGMLVQTTSTLNTYTYHRLIVDEAGVASAQTLVTDFNQRYQVAGSTPSQQPDGTALVEGDLWFDTGADTMKVYDGSNYAAVTSVGDYKLLTVVPDGATSGTPDYTNVSFDLRDGGSAASITSVGQLLVSVNGVLQKPNSTSWSASNEGFHLEGSNGIKFCTAPGSGASVFVTQIGTATAVNVPATNSIVEAAIQTNQVSEEKLKVSNNPTNGYLLSAQSGNDGGLTWVAAPSGTTNLSATANGTSLTVESSTGTNVALPAATTSAWGVMSDDDKTRLDGMADSANNYVHPNHSGDVTSSADGATTIANDAVTAAKTDISIVAGDLIYGNGTDSWTRLAKSTAGKVLTMNTGATAPEWADAAGGGAVGGGTDKIFIENGQTVTTNYTIGTEFGAACNALSAGPITINNGITVTIDSGDNWTIV